ncbi:DsbA family oxidoreductase [Frateuria defendens]|uniref:DsbA family oxidoreductase n=1 Tax=Frateuria defendens TaxID=2219559 RepID=UPI00066FE550|nr:DsbA family oxidoreductase [Frateuria defendens]
MSTPLANLQIDFVSDVVCPWCAVGLNALERALEDVKGELQAELHFQPFELNPGMGPAGEDIAEHLSRKYGLTPAQLKQNQDVLAERGAAVGFAFDLDKRQRTYNSFDAHRLLHWAGLEGRERELKHALLGAYFTEGQDISAHAVLAEAAAKAGLDPAQARAVLEQGRYAEEVRQQERHYQAQGIHSVPSVIVNGRYLIQGGQPPEVFAEALRKIAAEAAG